MELKKFIHILGVFILNISLLVSCEKTAENIEREHLAQAIDQVEIDNNTKWIVILPGLGCPGCIQVAEAFMKENIQNEEILFVLTRLSSLKILQQKLEIKLEDHSNIFIDRKDLFVVPTDNTNYPCIVGLKDTEIYMHIFQSPENDVAFDEFKSQLTTAQ